MHLSSRPPARSVHLPADTARTATPSERRKDLRVPLSAAVDLTSPDNFFAGRTRDISLGGLFIETTAALDVGAHVGVRIQILDRAFAVPTEVAWVLSDRAGRRIGIGVRFIAMPAPMVERIIAFMQQRTPIGFEIEVSR